MSLFYAIILGLIQGLTEFLPVSSSGHLVIAQSLLGFSEPPILFDVMLHGGTLLAIFVFFRKDIWMILSGIFTGAVKEEVNHSDATDANHPHRNEGSWFALLVIIGTIPALIVGFALKDFLEGLFSSPATVGFMLCITAAILYFADRQIRREKSIKAMSITDAILIGVLQAAAIIPGISRSGSTISMGIFRRLTSETAARFSFVLSIPAIIGAIVLEVMDVNEISMHEFGIYLVGTAVAAISGYLSISLLIKTIKSFKLKAFSIYLWIIGFAVIWMNILFKPAA
jgi:undecaprenyl-diphosphatase